MKTTKTITALMLGDVARFVVVAGSVAVADVSFVDDEDSLTPAAFADVDDSVFATTTSEPILLLRGTVLETSTDLSFDTPIGTWEHTRTYQSGLRLQQNGNSREAVSKEYFDAKGYLRWTIDAVGVVNYYGYHPVSGKRTLVVRDVDTTNLPTTITNGSTNVVAWKDKLPFSRSNSLATALNQTTNQEYDEQGRLVKTVGNDGISEFTIYDNNRRIQISAWDAKAKLPTLPIQVIETNDAGNVTSTYSVLPTNVVVEGNRPIGISSNKKQKVSWTRYHYAPLHGGLEYVDKYHTLATDEGKLGDNYYRTTHIRDQLGREVATARFVDNDKWQVRFEEGQAGTKKFTLPTRLV
ncbi:MAG: hypothetical protein LBU65_03420 [Planctomycetaceae bacterium]|nr:hypothetical protein [Planctomycetaceae bacterium]